MNVNGKDAAAIFTFLKSACGYRRPIGEATPLAPRPQPPVQQRGRPRRRKRTPL